MKKILSFLLTAALICSMVITTPLTASAKDAPSEWTAPEITLAEKLNLLTEKVKEDYQKEITREEFCELVVKLYTAITQNNPEIASNAFTDVNNEEISKAYGLGIVKGISNTEFAPNKYITREEICTMLVRCINKAFPELNTNDFPDYNELIQSYTDTSEISNWAFPSVSFAIDNEIMKGVYSDIWETLICPLDNTTREQAVLMSVRTYDTIEFISKNLGATMSYDSSEKHVEDLDKQRVLSKYVYKSSENILYDTYAYEWNEYGNEDFYKFMPSERNTAFGNLSESYTGIVLEGKNVVLADSQFNLIASTHRKGKHLLYPDYDWDNIIWQTGDNNIVEYLWQDGLAEGMLACFTAKTPGKTTITAIDGETGIKTEFDIVVSKDRSVLLDEEHKAVVGNIYNIPYAIKNGNEYDNNATITWSIENNTKDVDVISIFCDMKTSSKNMLTIKSLNIGECDLVMYEEGVEIARTHIVVKSHNYNPIKNNTNTNNNKNNKQGNVKKEQRQYYESQVDEFKSKFENAEITPENAGEYLILIEILFNEYSTELANVKWKYELAKLLLNAKGLVDDLYEIMSKISDDGDLVTVLELLEGDMSGLLDTLADKGIDIALKPLENKANETICEQIQNITKWIANNNKLWTNIKQNYLSENGFN